MMMVVMKMMMQVITMKMSHMICWIGIVEDHIYDYGDFCYGDADDDDENLVAFINIIMYDDKAYDRDLICVLD